MYLTEACVLQICVAWTCQGFWPLDNVVSLLPTEQDPDPCAFSGSCDSCYWEKVLSCAPGSGWSSSFQPRFCYILTMIDRTSRWPEAVPLSSITAESCARAFISTWISRFGVPALLTSDRGAQFTSSIWLEVCSVLGISHIQTTK